MNRQMFGADSLVEIRRCARDTELRLCEVMWKIKGSKVPVTNSGMDPATVDALNFKNIGKREKRDQKIPQRNFIISEEWAGICYGLE
ncbi:hypothetical protein DUI87_13300 [Hirundo rustica rustica]|uniref:Uncharacterized protein n=1 Tax=Hirundo rustica rustica TaxID=333673 RepID=A0A3M0KBN6_HIRRU|nr:hypothetical protein DUI87_13300 [Hirundo rustica rustica]